MKRPATVRDAVFELLRAFGMTTVFGNPGSTELPMFRDFPDDFRYSLALQESIAVGMADGYAQATRNAALVSLHSAAGLGHALGNVFTAYKNQTPLVIVAGQQARSILPFEPFLYAKEATEFPKPYVKWSCEPARAEDVPAAIARAYYVAMQAPCGPTFVSVPVDDWDRPCEPIAPRTVSRSIRGEPALLRQCATELNHAARPAIVVGASVARDGAWAEVIALAERHRAPVWVSPMSSRNSFPENHPLFAGFLPADRGRIVAHLTGHDFVLVLGAPVFTYHVEGSGPHWPEHASLLALSDDPNHLASLPGGGGVLGEVRAGLEALFERVQTRAFSGTSHKLIDPEPRMTAAYVLKRIAALRPSEAVIVEEAPTARGPEHDTLPITREGGFYTCASGGLGYSLPAAVGVAKGQDDKVIAILGDGSAMYTIQGLFSAREERANVSFVILNNGAYAALTGFSAEFGMNHVPGCDLTGIDFVKLAEAQGLPAKLVDSLEALDAALAWSFEQVGPTLLDVRIEYAIHSH
jgi:benzoylformate decarboxylase